MENLDRVLRCLKERSMELVVERSELNGEITIPGSKSHTIRAVALASMASGTSVIRQPLGSRDTQACIRGCRALGARMRCQGDVWTIHGVAGKPHAASDVVDLMNSGTSLRLLTSLACLTKEATVFTGDSSLRQRLMGSLLKALSTLGAKPFSTQGNGLPPVVCRGPLLGGQAEVDGTTSQYMSSLLIALPLARKDSQIQVKALRERPYVDMTLSWLKSLGVSATRHDWSRFDIPAGQSYQPFDRSIPADFSSATFPLCAACMAGGEVRLKGLDMDDVQGDKAVVDFLRKMKARISEEGSSLIIRGGPLQGAELDLSDTPDALPALAVVGCVAEGETHLCNVPQARIKECDRLSVMTQELGKMGADIKEETDGLLIRKCELKGAKVSSHGDHRVAMALVLAGLMAQGTTRVAGAETISVTYPGFAESLQSLGASLSLR